MRSDVAGERKDYFDALYVRDGDPWRYDACDYEIAKRADTLSFLQPRYRRACEIGCSIGVLTEELAGRCDALIGVDIAAAAAAQARARTAELPQVEIRVMELPRDDLDGVFDLLVLSEVLYFLGPDEIAAMVALAARRVGAGGEVLIVSFDGETQTSLTGRQATDCFLAHASAMFDLHAAEQRDGYHVRLLRRRDGD